MKNLITVLAMFVSCSVCFAQQESTPKNESTTVKVICASKTILDNSPLYLLDGIELCPEDLKNIKPEDIAAVNVLKDKSATAVYGEKGKNGVILIELKKRKKDSGER